MEYLKHLVKMSAVISLVMLILTDSTIAAMVLLVSSSMMLGILIGELERK